MKNCPGYKKIPKNHEVAHSSLYDRLYTDELEVQQPTEQRYVNSKIGVLEHQYSKQKFQSSSRRICYPVKTRRKVFLESLDKFHSNPSGSKWDKTSSQTWESQMLLNTLISVCWNTKIPRYFFNVVLSFLEEIATSAPYFNQTFACVLLISCFL